MDSVLTSAAAPKATMPVLAWRAYQGVSQSVDEKELISRYLPLVRNVVDRIKLNLPSHIEGEELYSVGVTGLISAVQKYRPENGVTFSSYAATRIRGAVLDELRRIDWCPRRARSRARKIKDAINRIEQRTGRPAVDAEICTELGLGEREYFKWVDESRPATFIPIDQRLESEEGDGGSLHEIFADQNDQTGRDAMEDEELRRVLAERIAELPEIPKKVLSMYYYEKMRLAEIAQVFGLTESRICQIHARTILGLRAALERARVL